MKFSCTTPTHEELIGSVLEVPLSEEDALLWMVLLHTHHIHVHSTGPANGQQSLVLHPLTQRGAAETIARLWPERAGERSNYLYWYWQYNSRMGYEDLSQLPEQVLARLHKLRDRLALEPRVKRIIEDT